MTLNMTGQIWDMIKDSIIPTDRDSVAENLIHILIDNDYSPAEIRTIFRDDYDIMSALKYVVDDAVEFEEEETEYEEYNESDDYNDNDDEY